MKKINTESGVLAPQEDMESVYSQLSEELPSAAVDQGMVTPTRLQVSIIQHSKRV